MDNSLRDISINIKKSLDRDYNVDSDMEPNFDDDQKMLSDNFISDVGDSYESDYEDIIVDHSDDEAVLIEPEQGVNIDTIRLVKIKSLNSLSDELDNVNKTGVPAILDLKYIQERRASEFRKLSSTLKAFKNATNASVILLGSTKNVIGVTPKDIRVLRQ